jgi:hypothetical protein
MAVATERELEIYRMPSSTPEERAAQVAALIELAQDPTDAYDGHHGNDRTDAAIAVAEVIDPARAETA